MRKTLLGLFAISAFIVPSLSAGADSSGATTGAVGGAVTGAVVGGPVGAVIGGAAGAVVGGAVTGPNHTVVVHEHDPAVEPCSTTQVQRSDAAGNSSTTTRTDCP